MCRARQSQLARKKKTIRLLHRSFQISLIYSICRSVPHQIQLDRPPAFLLPRSTRFSRRNKHKQSGALGCVARSEGPSPTFACTHQFVAEKLGPMYICNSICIGTSVIPTIEAGKRRYKNRQTLNTDGLLSVHTCHYPKKLTQGVSCFQLRLNHNPRRMVSSIQTHQA